MYKIPFSFFKGHYKRDIFLRDGALDFHLIIRKEFDAVLVSENLVENSWNLGANVLTPMTKIGDDICFLAPRVEEARSR